ncbi:carbonic anhydrase [Sphingomonas solaris]|uniref:Carbonic anhydrase n=1 Tax=Alterirhizorhabdus solaris TaxID=2529389 RepID=A0A558QRJ0_9SPHN|nr:carbonic anhydrase [Sphingomonas solaris]TVV69756.1 carbonic anhydrase [Sphingomonas solaris]
MKGYKQLILANMAWAAEQAEEDPDYFARQIAGQKPNFLWIGCSDSRVAPDQLTRSPPGGLFIHRNIANLVSESDGNLMSVVQYAVEILEIDHVIVCGHYRCGGVTAAMEGGVSGDIDEWLEVVREVGRNHADEIAAMPDAETKVNRLVECNVRDQLIRLARTPIVQRAFASGRDLQLHGWVYDLRDGLIKPLLEMDRETVLDEVGTPNRVL